MVLSMDQVLLYCTVQDLISRILTLLVFNLNTCVHSWKRSPRILLVKWNGILRKCCKTHNWVLSCCRTDRVRVRFSCHTLFFIHSCTRKEFFSSNHLLLKWSLCLLLTIRLLQSFHLQNALHSTALLPSALKSYMQSTGLTDTCLWMHYVSLGVCKKTQHPFPVYYGYINPGKNSLLCSALGLFWKQLPSGSGDSRGYGHMSDFLQKQGNTRKITW